MLTPQRRKEMDAILGKSTPPITSPTATALTPERRQQMDAVLGKSKPSQRPIPTETGAYLSGMAKNVIPSAGRAVKDIWGAVSKPGETLQGLKGLGKGIIGKFTPGKQAEEANVDALVDYYKTRYGKDLKRTLYEDPFGAVMDASTLAGGAGGLLKGAGAVSKASTLTKAGKALTTASKATDPFEVAGRMAAAPVSKLASKISPAESIYFRGIGSPAKMEDLNQMAKKFGYKSAMEFAEKYGLSGRDPARVEEVLSGLYKQYDIGATKGGTYGSATNVIKGIDNEIARMVKSGELQSDAGQIRLAELQKRRSLFEAKLGGGRTPLTGETVTPTSELVQFRKTAIDPDIKWDATKPTAQVKATKKVRDIIRDEINKSNPELKQLGLDIALAEEIAPIFERYQARGASRQLLNFSKLGSSTIGAVTRGVPGAITGFLVENLVNNPQFLAAIAKARGTSTAVKKLFSPVGKAIKGTYLFGKGARGLGLNQSTTSQKPSPQQLKNFQSYK